MTNRFIPYEETFVITLGPFDPTSNLGLMIFRRFLCGPGGVTSPAPGRFANTSVKVRITETSVGDVSGDSTSEDVWSRLFWFTADLPGISGNLIGAIVVGVRARCLRSAVLPCLVESNVTVANGRYLRTDSGRLIKESTSSRSLPSCCFEFENFLTRSSSSTYILVAICR
jgi:hypothetical protein